MGGSGIAAANAAVQAGAGVVAAGGALGGGILGWFNSDSKDGDSIEGNGDE